jgi:hypothetical protein
MFPQQQENTAIMEEMFSTRSMPRCCNQYQLAVAVRELLGFSRCEMFPLEVDSWGRVHLKNPELGERQPLETSTQQRQWRRGCEH